ncbi:hypothetical protein ACRRTK_017960 [Alexandromys fortis]
MSGREGEKKKKPLEQTRKQAGNMGQEEKVFKQKPRGADETRGAKANAVRNKKDSAQLHHTMVSAVKIGQ